MRTGLLVPIFTLLASGCSMLQKQVVSPCGVEGYIQIPAGSKIENVKLPTDENKTYTVVTSKDGFWMSLACHDLQEKGK